MASARTGGGSNGVKSVAAVPSESARMGGRSTGVKSVANPAPTGRKCTSAKRAVSKHWSPTAAPADDVKSRWTVTWGIELALRDLATSKLRREHLGRSGAGIVEVGIRGESPGGLRESRVGVAGAHNLRRLGRTAGRSPASLGYRRGADPARARHAAAAAAAAAAD